MHNIIKNKSEYQNAIDELVLKAAISSLLEIEGNKLIEENNRLKNDPRFQLSPEIDKKIKQAIRRSESRYKFKKFRKVAGGIVSKVAVVFLAIFVGLTSTMAVSADFRKIIYNLILSYDERYTQVERSTEYKEFVDSDVYTWEHIFAPTMLPHGYKLTSVDDNGTIFAVLYENAENLYIEFTQHSSNGKFRADTENAQKILTTFVGDSEALVVEKDGVIIITWQVGDFLLYIISNDQTDTVLNFAESIKLMR